MTACCTHTRTLGGKKFICVVVGVHSTHHMRSEADQQRILARTA